MIARCITLFLFLLCCKAYTQEPAHYVIGKDVFDGVHLYSITQDDTDNSIWISSNKGLYNYNGITFTHQIPKNSKSSALFKLTKNINGIIFCHNLNGQIFKLNNKKLELFYTIPKVYSGDISGFEFDNLNNLYINNKKGELLIVDAETKAIKTSTKNINNLLKNKDTIHYIQKHNKKEFLVKKTNNHNTKQKVKGNLNIQLFSINNTFLGLDLVKNQLYKLKSNSFIKIPQHNIEKSMYNLFLSQNHLWLSNLKKGVYAIPKNRITANINVKKWFNNYFISGAFTDNENNTWLLTFNNGIIIIPNLQNSITKPPNGTEFKSISKTDKQLHITTANGQIYQIKNQQFLPYYTTDKDDRNEFIKVFPKKNIVITSNKVYWKNHKKTIGFCRDAVLINNSLLLGTPSGLVKFHLHKKNKTLSKGRVYNIYHDTTSQKTWFATTSGLKLYKKGKTLPVLNRGKDILEAKIEAVNNQIWVASKNGIYIFKNDSIVNQLTTKDGLLNNDVNDIKYEKPYVYLAYQKGMQRYNSITKTFTNFTFADGLTKSISQFEVLNDTIYAINSNGLLRFTFSNKNKNTKRLVTKITKAIANGTTQITNNDKLDANQNNLSFAFLASTFKYQKEISYQYQLIGIDKKPIKASENQLTVNYANVTAGNYTFKVDSFIKNIPNQSATLHFSIKEVWYKTLWFKLSIVSLSLFILYYIYKTRLNAVIRKRDKEVLQKRLAQSSLTSLKAQMNPHFLFNAMNSIQTLILKKENKDAYEYLTQLSDLVRENLKMSDVSFVHFHDELQLINKYLELEKLRFKETLTYTIENQLANDDFYIPSMLIQPFIENAIKHGLLHKKTNRVLAINFTKNDDSTILCTITDNGIGRVASNELNKNRNYKSFSTNAINKRFSVLNEYFKLDISFKYEDLYKGDTALGTKVTITLPFSNDKFE